MVKNLRKLRTEKGISQRQLADVIGISQQSVNKYENHNVEPDIDTLIRIADYFHTTVDDLIGHEAENEADRTEKKRVLNTDEDELLQKYRSVSESEKESIQLVLTNYVKHISDLL